MMSAAPYRIGINRVDYAKVNRGKTTNKHGKQYDHKENMIRIFGVDKKSRKSACLLVKGWAPHMSIEIPEAWACDDLMVEFKSALKLLMSDLPKDDGSTLDSSWAFKHLKFEILRDMRVSSDCIIRPLSTVVRIRTPDAWMRKKIAMRLERTGLLMSEGLASSAQNTPAYAPPPEVCGPSAGKPLVPAPMHRFLRTCEWDLMPAIQFRIDTDGIGPGKWIDVDKWEASSRIHTRCALEMEVKPPDLATVDDDHDIPPLRCLLYDIEVLTPGGDFPDYLLYLKNETKHRMAKHAVSCIAGEAFSLGDRPNAELWIGAVRPTASPNSIGYTNLSAFPETVTFNPNESGYNSITIRMTYFATERALILAFFRLVSQCDIDISYNGAGFDMPYLWYRGLYLNIPERVLGDFGKVLGETCRAKPHTFSTAATGFTKDCPWTLTGISTLDLLPDCKKRFSGLDNHKLDTVMKFVLGIGKDDMSPARMTKGLMCGTAEERTLVYLYCMRDVHLLGQLIEKASIVESYLAAAAVTGIDLLDQARRGQQVRIQSVAAQMARQMQPMEIMVTNPYKLVNVPEKTRARDGKSQYEGAVVIEPKQLGLYGNPRAKHPRQRRKIACLDFGSLYPSETCSHNLSFGTIILRTRRDWPCVVKWLWHRAWLRAQKGSNEGLRSRGVSNPLVPYSVYQRLHDAIRALPSSWSDRTVSVRDRVHAIDAFSGNKWTSAHQRAADKIARRILRGGSIHDEGIQKYWTPFFRIPWHFIEEDNVDQGETMWVVQKSATGGAALLPRVNYLLLDGRAVDKKRKAISGTISTAFGLFLDGAESAETTLKVLRKERGEIDKFDDQRDNVLRRFQFALHLGDIDAFEQACEVMALPSGMVDATHRNFPALKAHLAKVKLRKQAEDQMQNAEKVTCNSTYGATGVEAMRTLCYGERGQYVSRGITFWGRTDLHRTRDLVEAMRFIVTRTDHENYFRNVLGHTPEEAAKLADDIVMPRKKAIALFMKLTGCRKKRAKQLIKEDCSLEETEIVYGDTDSVFLTVPEQWDAEKIHKVMGYVAKAIDFHLERPMRLEYEKHYNAYFLMSKKRYGGDQVDAGDSAKSAKLKKKGMHIQRRDSTAHDKHVGEAVLKAILRGQIAEAEAIGREGLRKILDWEVPAYDCSVSMQLSKDKKVGKGDDQRTVDSYHGFLGESKEELELMDIEDLVGATTERDNRRRASKRSRNEFEGHEALPDSIYFGNAGMTVARKLRYRGEGNHPEYGDRFNFVICQPGFDTDPKAWDVGVPKRPRPFSKIPVASKVLFHAEDLTTALQMGIPPWDRYYARKLVGVLWKFFYCVDGKMDDEDMSTKSVADRVKREGMQYVWEKLTVGLDFKRPPPNPRAPLRGMERFMGARKPCAMCGRSAPLTKGLCPNCRDRREEASTRATGEADRVVGTRAELRKACLKCTKGSEINATACASRTCAVMHQRIVNERDASVIAEHLARLQIAYSAL
jgi:DNA polymerase elongation subunit (family B)